MPIDQATRDYAAKVRADLNDAVMLLDDLGVHADGARPIVRVLLAQVRITCVEAGNALGDVLTDEPAPAPRGKPDARANRDHRHRFNAAGACEVQGCGKQRSPNGRKPAEREPMAAPPADTRTEPLPGFRPGAADDFAGGNHGSSGMRR